MFMPALSSAFGLSTRAMEKVALKSVNVQATFKNLLCETTMRQVYRNLEEKPIEAVYTFPLASSAVLLGLKVTIGKRELEGNVVEKAQAEENYEEAITEGNTAIMLERLSNGLYTMNVGNILAGEEITITITYAELYTWQGNTLRFHLPTTIAPRYGNPEEAGLQPHQEPEYDLLAENRFQLKLTLSGPLASAQLECPSHKISVSASPGETVATLAASEAFMDRDFILNIRMPEGGKDFVLLDRDFDGGYVALASFAPSLPMEEETQPKSVKIVVDCSSSMSGDSITQAKQAISDILKQLRPTDYFNLLAFGSTVTAVFSRQVKANKNNLTKVRRILRSIDANMGGTEMHRALLATVEVSGPEILQDILLITDGQVWKSDEIISMVKEYKHRVFTVGVGSAVSEEFVRRLSTESGGACELVSPNEKMAEKIVRHFKRIYLPQAEKVEIQWPIEPVNLLPNNRIRYLNFCNYIIPTKRGGGIHITKNIIPTRDATKKASKQCSIGKRTQFIFEPLFDGDTLHAFAFFSTKPMGPVLLNLTLSDGSTMSRSISLQEGAGCLAPGKDIPGPLARMAINQSLGGEEEIDAAQLAIKYQLISPYTKYLVVEERAASDRGLEFPKLRKMPQMLAAGWGGTSRAVNRACRPFNSNFSQRSSMQRARVPSEETLQRIASNRKECITPETFVRAFDSAIQHVADIKEIQELAEGLLPKWLLRQLKSIVAKYDPQAPDDLIVLAFLFALTQSAIGDRFSRGTRRLLLKATKTHCLDEGLNKIIVDTLANIKDNDWGSNLFSRRDKLRFFLD